MIKKISTAFYTDGNIFYFNEDSGNVVVSVMEWVFLICTFRILTLMILIMMKMILILLSLPQIWVWVSILNLINAKHIKKISEELKPIAWHPKRWWNFCMSEEEKKEIEAIFTD